MEQDENENLFRTIFESSPECVKLLDQNGIILDINPAGLEMVGASHAEIVGQAVHKLICLQYQDAYYQLLQDALSGEQRTIEFEIGEEQGARRWMEARIAPLIGDNDASHLLVGITRDIHEKKLALLESERLSTQNRWLAQQLMEAQEVERKQIAQELHDNLGQQLLAIRLDAEFIQHEKQSGSVIIKSTAEHILKLTERISREVRSLSEQLHPLALQYMGLSDSLQELVREWKVSQKNIVVTYRADVNDLPLLPEKSALALYRVLQEGLANISRHSNATAVNITLKYLTQNEWPKQIADVDSEKKSKTSAHSDAVGLTIQDNGRGINFDMINPGRGLLGMRERIGALNGQLIITSTSLATTPEDESQRSAIKNTESGTTITATLPLDPTT